MAGLTMAGANAGTVADIGLRTAAGQVINRILAAGRNTMFTDAVAFTGGVLIFPNLWVPCGELWDHDDASAMNVAKQSFNELPAAMLAEALQHYIRMTKQPSFSAGRLVHIYLSILLANLVKNKGVTYFPGSVIEGWVANDRNNAAIARKGGTLAE